MSANVHNIVLIGETGNGKSSLGNFILGSSEFEVSEDPDSCTKDTIQKISKLDPEIGVVDTPGLQDSNGEDKQNYDKMLKIFEEIKHLHFIVVVLNFNNARLTSSIQFMLKFLCSVFPKNFSLHVGIVFTHYDHDYQTKIYEKKNLKDPQRSRDKYIDEVMQLIEKYTGEKNAVKKPPVYFLDSFIEDDNSKKQRTNLINFAKFLKPIENVRTDRELGIKKTEPVYENRVEEKVEGNLIVTYYKKFKRMAYTDYDDNVTYSDWELVDTQTSSRALPVNEVTKTEYVYRDRDSDDSKSDDSKNDSYNDNAGDDGNSFVKEMITTVAKLFIGKLLFGND